MKIPFIQSIIDWLSGAAKKVKEALTIGNSVANTVKSITDSPLLDIVVNLTPTSLDNVALAYVRTGLINLINTMGWAQKKVSDFDSQALPHVLNTINAESAYLVAEYESLELSRQQAIASAQVVYSPNIMAG